MRRPKNHTIRHQDHAFTSNRSQNVAIITLLAAVIGAILGVANARHLGFSIMTMTGWSMTLKDSFI